MGLIEKYYLISNIVSILAIAFLILSIFLFFIFHIPKTVLDLSGITQRRAVRQIGKENRAKKESEVEKRKKCMEDTMILSDSFIGETQVLQNHSQDMPLECARETPFVIVQDITYMQSNLNMEV